MRGRGTKAPRWNGLREQNERRRAQTHRTGNMQQDRDCQCCLLPQPKAAGTGLGNELSLSPSCLLASSVPLLASFVCPDKLELPMLCRVASGALRVKCPPTPYYSPCFEAQHVVPVVQVLLLVVGGRNSRAVRQVDHLGDVVLVGRPVSWPLL